MVQRDMRLCERIIDDRKKEINQSSHADSLMLTELDAMIDSSGMMYGAGDASNPFLSKDTGFLELSQHQRN